MTKRFVRYATACLTLGAAPVLAMPAAFGASAAYSAKQVVGSCRQVGDADQFTLAAGVSGGAASTTYTVSSQNVTVSLRTDATGSGMATLNGVYSVRPSQNVIFARGSSNVSVAYVNTCATGSGR